ncbi:MAG: transcriptional regulator [Sphingomonas sp.]|uniref:winged helix-turn-helix transcriptional regulator n=1 Tax=Sphingomonas sp. TaxID=28214 RepID=UPI0017C8DCDF|nr:winged helix-turn-helix transcriptional regulator [Sphingomonas sp.]MBA3666907.1 transcriptional regulator [Sphingomonas sp.]
MAKRSYNQYCAVARGLDVVGDRWTLLLVRELLLGPKRYGDLLAASPGIGTNLLADRLREMEAQGLLERVTLPPPAGSNVYRLTDAGVELETVVRALGRWGRRFMGPRREGEKLSTGAYFVALRERFRPERSANLHEAYEFRVDGRVFEVTVNDGTSTTGEGSAVRPAAVFTMDTQTLNDIFLGQVTARRAIADERVEVAGDAKALGRFQAMFPSV